jgi:hypothetical protein
MLASFRLTISSVDISYVYVLANDYKKRALDIEEVRDVMITFLHHDHDHGRSRSYRPLRVRED